MPNSEDSFDDPDPIELRIAIEEALGPRIHSAKTLLQEMFNQKGFQLPDDDDPDPTEIFARKPNPYDPGSPGIRLPLP